MNLLNKKAGESDYEYHKRIINGKLIDKTLSDYDYSELAPLVYGKEYSADVARRMMYGSAKTIDLIEQDLYDYIIQDNLSDSFISEIEAKKAELEKERQRFYDQRREYKKLIREEGRDEYITERLTHAAETLSESFTPIPDARRSALSHAGRDAVIVFADWHYGMNAHNIWNDYDIDIFRQRLRNIIDSAIEKIKINGVRNIHIVILGDMIHGAIHNSARVASNELVSDQLMHVSEYLARAIIELSSYADTTFVHSTYGNHARTVQNKKDSIHRDNIERIIPWWLEQRVKHIDNITIDNDSDTEFIHFNVRGHGFCGSHGDLDSVKSSPRLLYSLFEKKYGEKIEVILLGDKHHRESFEELGVMSIISGSLCGSDGYANDHRLYSSPEQLMITVTDDGVDAIYHLKCE